MICGAVWSIFGRVSLYTCPSRIRTPGRKAPFRLLFHFDIPLRPFRNAKCPNKHVQTSTLRWGSTYFQKGKAQIQPPAVYCDVTPSSGFLGSCAARTSLEPPPPFCSRLSSLAVKRGSSFRFPPFDTLDSKEGSPPEVALKPPPLVRLISK